MLYTINLTTKYTDAYSGELQITDNERLCYKCNVVILKELVDKIQEKGLEYKIAYKSDAQMLIALCPTIAVGRTRISLVPVQGKSKHDHCKRYIYLVAREKKYVYEGDVYKLSRKFFDRSSEAAFHIDVTDYVDEPYFFSGDTVRIGDEDELDDWGEEYETFG